MAAVKELNSSCYEKETEYLPYYLPRLRRVVKIIIAHVIFYYYILRLG